MQRHCENGAKIAHFLQAHSAVDKVYWPGFTSHSNHLIAKQQMKDYGGMLSFTLKGNQLSDAQAVFSHLQLFSLAES